MKNIHGIKKFDNGQRTPQEMHSQYAFRPGEVCAGCGRPPLISITSFGEEAEMLKRDNRLLILRAANPESYAAMRIVTRMGPYLRIGRVLACRECGPALEKAAAKHPSWTFVEIDRGPQVINPQVGYGS